MKRTTNIIVIVLIISITTYIIYYKISHRGTVYVKSDIDNEFYLVRDLPDRQHACNMLAKIKQNLVKLVKYLNDNKAKYPDYATYITRCNDRLANCIINEGSEDSVYTSYSINKGEQIVFCLRSRKYNTGQLHDINLVMYVALHELSHVASPEYGHTDLFKKIFAFMTNIAVQLNLYDKISFNTSNTEYCGLIISESII